MYRYREVSIILTGVEGIMNKGPKIEEFSPDELYFDEKNPRLVEMGYAADVSEEEILKTLWYAMDVREIVLSIAASGFFSIDPIIVDKSSGKNIVIEGNRRLAAVRIIRNPEKYRSIIEEDIPKVDPEKVRSTDTLPAAVMSREEAWQFLGFKHVNGPAKWGSYAKARYIATVHNEYGVPLSEIGRQIGDTHRTVQRLYRGLMVIEQAEKTGVFNREDAYRGSLPFSHLYVGLQREGIQGFLNLKDAEAEDKQPVPEDKIQNLEQVCKWLFGSKSDNIEPVVQSQNPDLKNLDKVLQNGEALAALQDGEALSVAVDYTVPAGQALERELLTAKRSLVRARGLVTEGFDGSQSLLDTAFSVWQHAADLTEDMERKMKDDKPRRPPRRDR